MYIHIYVCTHISVYTYMCVCVYSEKEAKNLRKNEDG